MVVTFVFRVHVRVLIASHDTIQHGVMWHDMDKNSIMFICE